MMRRIRRLLIVAVATAALSGVPFGLWAIGEEENKLGGYQMTAQATAISFIYNQPSFGLPTDPTFELRKVHSLATTDSGPSGRALSSAVWPGDAAGNADPALILDLILFDPTRDGYLTPYVPDVRESMKAGITEECRTSNCTYPIRAEAFYPEAEGHPSFSSYPAGTVQMRSRAQEGVSEATTFTNDTGEEEMLFVGGMSSYTITEVRNGVAIAKAVTHLQEVSVLGLFSFDAIDTVAEATSDGKVAKPRTSVTITGLSIDAPCRQPGADPKTCAIPIFVDDKGLHVRSDTYDPTGGQALKAINDYLKPNGFDIVVTRGSGRADTEAAQAFGAVNGLIIRMNSAGMNTLIDSIPNEEVKTWIRSPSHRTSPLRPLFNLFSSTIAGYATSFTQGDQTMLIVFGDASVDAAAAPEFSFDLPDFETLPIDTGGFTSTPVGGGDLGGGFTGPAAQPPASGGRTFIPSVPVAVKGVPGGIGGLVALLGVLAAVVLRRFADATTAAAPAEICSLERELP